MLCDPRREAMGERKAVTRRVSPATGAAKPGVHLGSSGKRVLVWIRGSGHLRPERWHLRRDTPGRPSRLAQIVTACGALFNVADVTDLAYSGWMPAERNRCPGCDLVAQAD
jgi:hypothetical protein